MVSPCPFLSLEVHVGHLTGGGLSVINEKHHVYHMSGMCVLVESVAGDASVARHLGELGGRELQARTRLAL